MTTDEDYVLAGPADEGIERYHFTGSLQAIREYLADPHVRQGDGKVYRLVEVASVIECPECGLIDPIRDAVSSVLLGGGGEFRPSVFRADQPARDGRAEVTCPKCGHRFEIRFEL
jgi:DNA-directed RNA polymerase subunit RPC12/RpoP